MQPETLAKLVKVSRELSAFDDLDALAQSIVDTAAQLCAAESSSLLLFDEEEKQLRYVAASWFPQNPRKRAAIENIPVPVQGSVSGWVFDQGECRIVKKIGKDPLVHAAAEAHFITPVLCIAAVPVRYQKLIIGVLECYNRAGGDFHEDDILALETLASQAAVAIYNAHLLARTQAAYQELANLDRMKSDFIAITSHELRTPLGVIIGHTSLLQEIADRDTREHLTAIERNAAILREIVENLTTVNHFDTKNAPLLQTRVPVGALLEKAAQHYAEAAQQKKIVLRATPPEPPLFILGDEEKLGIALNNLLKNALAFTEGDKGRVLLNARAQGGQVKISVIDNGIGIPQKDLARIFERFVQVEGHMRRKHGGMGLGLSVAKYMVELHGGTIWAESVEGEGSSFSMLLPLAEAHTPAAASVFLTD
jgi:signal transduction histidine kinase